MTYRPTPEFFDRSNRQAQDYHQCEFVYPDGRRCWRNVDMKYLYCYGHNKQVKEQSK